MKKIILLIIIITSSFITKAQWSGGTDLTSLTSRSGSVSLTSPTSYLSLGNALYFGQSGNAPDGFPYGRFIENYGIRFGSPNSTWVLSTKTSFLAGFQPAGEDWGTGNIYASNKLGIGTTNLLNGLNLFSLGDFNNGSIRFGHSGTNDGVMSLGYNSSTGRDALKFSYFPHSSSSGQTDLMTLDVNGNIGIGTPGPIEKLDVNGNINVPIGKTIGYAVNAGQGFTHDNNALGAYSIGWAFDNWADGRGSGGPTGNFSGWGGLKFFTANQPRMSIDNSGNVGIGNTAPDAKLTVTGLVHAQEVKVTVAAPGPDYVFEKDYKLTSLEEIKNYIDQNKHLPEVPSAKEMEKNGVQLGEMNMLLLKKIEELTLYVIEQNKEFKDLKSKNKKLEDKVTTLEIALLNKK